MIDAGTRRLPQSQAGGTAVITSTEDETLRSHGRNRRAMLTGFSSILAKLVVLITTLLSVPLTFQYLGADRYGLWMTITSLVLFLGFADFGMGNGLASALAEANGRDDIVFARQQVSCAFYLLIGIAAVLLCILAAAYPFIPWQQIYRTRTALATAEAGPATAVLVICAALNMPLGTVLRVQIGYQKGYIGDLWNALGNLMALVSVFIAVKLHLGLPVLVAGLAGAPLIATAANWIIQFQLQTPWLKPRLALIEWRSMCHLARTGFLFFVQQCFGLIYYVSDNIVIAQTLDSPHVARFAVMQRVFSIGLVSQYFMTPLWPAFGEALVRRDFSWARRTIKRAIAGNFLIGGACGVILLFASGPIVKRWTGADAGPIDAFRYGLCLWVILVGYIAAMNAFLNQRGVMAKYLIYFGGASMLSLALKIVLVHYWSLAGVVWATLIGFGLVYVVPAARLAFANLRVRAREAELLECVPCL